MARNFLTPINLNKLELQDAVIQNKTGGTINGITPVAGQLYYDSTNNVLRVATGTSTTNWLTVATNQTTGSYTSAITIGATSINIGSSASSLSNVSISGSGTWTATNIAVANGGTGTSTGSITGTAALTFTAGGTNTNVNLVPNGTGSVDVASKKITSLAYPTASTDAANKQYVDDAIAGLDWKTSVAVTNTAATSLAGMFTASGTINETYTATSGSNPAYITLSLSSGVWSTTTWQSQTLTAGDRVLLRNQGSITGATTAGSSSGIYTVGAIPSGSSSWVFTRASDADGLVNSSTGTTGELASGAAVYVEKGTSAGASFILTTTGTITLGTTAQTWTQFTGAQAFTWSDGLTASGNTVSVNLDSSPSGLKFNTGKLAVDASQLYIGTSNVVLANSAPVSQALTGISSITGSLAAFTLKPADRTGIGVGYSTTVQAGASDTSNGGVLYLYGGTTTSAAGNGGAVNIFGGTGTGAGSGGAVYVDGGNHATAANIGKVYIGTSSTQTEVGNASYTTKLWGNVQLTNLASGSDTNFVKFNSTTKALTYDTASYANLAAANSFVYAGTQTFKYSAATDSIILAPRNGGSASYGISLTTGTLTASGTLTLPDTGGATQQVARIVSGTATLTAQATIAATHNLQRQLVHAQLFDSSYNLIETDIVLTSTTVTTFNFAANQTGTYYWVITG
jgi:hypothetical protein